MKNTNILARMILLSFMVPITLYAEGRTFSPEPPSKEMREEMRQKMENLRNLCATDIASLCAEAEGPGVIHCLKKNQASLSVEACQQEVAQLPDRPQRPRHPKGAFPSEAEEE